MTQTTLASFGFIVKCNFGICSLKLTRSSTGGEKFDILQIPFTSGIVSPCTVIKLSDNHIQFITEADMWSYIYFFIYVIERLYFSHTVLLILRLIHPSIFLLSEEKKNGKMKYFHLNVVVAISIVIGQAASIRKLQLLLSKRCQCTQPYRHNVQKYLVKLIFQSIS